MQMTKIDGSAIFFFFLFPSSQLQKLEVLRNVRLIMFEDLQVNKNEKR